MNLAAWKDRAVAARRRDGRPAARGALGGGRRVDRHPRRRGARAGRRAARGARHPGDGAARWPGSARIVTALDDGRVADALRVAARRPSPRARVPADLAVRLAETAGTAMAPTLDEAEWKDLLDAVVNSPVRRTVKPAGLPADASAELLTAARRAAGLVPELARLLGLPIPPPPGPPPGRSRRRPSRADPPGLTGGAQPSTPWATRKSSSPSTSVEAGHLGQRAPRPPPRHRPRPPASPRRRRRHRRSRGSRSGSPAPSLGPADAEARTGRERRLLEQLALDGRGHRLARLHPAPGHRPAPRLGRRGPLHQQQRAVDHGDATDGHHRRRARAGRCRSTTVGSPEEVGAW